MYITFMFGLCFTLLPDWSGAVQTELYQLTTLQTHEFTTSIWGVCAIAACVFAAAAFYYRKRWLGAFAGLFGFGVWFFAAVTYIIGGFWFGLLVAAIPLVVFWSYLFFKIEAYHRRQT